MRMHSYVNNSHLEVYSTRPVTVYHINSEKEHEKDGPASSVCFVGNVNVQQLDVESK